MQQAVGVMNTAEISSEYNKLKRVPLNLQMFKTMCSLVCRIRLDRLEFWGMLCWTLHSSGSAPHPTEAKWCHGR